MYYYFNIFTPIPPNLHYTYTYLIVGEVEGKLNREQVKWRVGEV